MDGLVPIVVVHFPAHKDAFAAVFVVGFHDQLAPVLANPVEQLDIAALHVGGACVGHSARPRHMSVDCKKLLWRHSVLIDRIGNQCENSLLVEVFGSEVVDHADLSVAISLPDGLAGIEALEEFRGEQAAVDEVDGLTLVAQALPVVVELARVGHHALVAAAIEESAKDFEFVARWQALVVDDSDHRLVDATPGFVTLDQVVQEGLAGVERLTGEFPDKFFHHGGREEDVLHHVVVADTGWRLGVVFHEAHFAAQHEAVQSRGDRELGVARVHSAQTALLFAQAQGVLQLRGGLNAGA